jgi:hypothetical protein
MIIFSHQDISSIFERCGTYSVVSKQSGHTIVAPDGALLALASANDWIVLQDMSEKTVGNIDNSALVLVDVSSGNADTYVVHYDLCDVGTFFGHWRND